MNVWLRILSGIVVALTVAFVMVIFMLYFFGMGSPKLAGGVGVAAGFLTFKLIRPSKNEIKKMTKASFVYYENGNIKEKGKLISGKREGDWDFFNERGKFVETKKYKQGTIIS